MIFYDQKTADEVRRQANNDLKEFMFNFVKEWDKNYDYWKDLKSKINREFALSDESIKQYVSEKIDYHLPRTVSTLLWRSGLIYPYNHGAYDTLFYYDNMDTWPQDELDTFYKGFTVMRKHGTYGGICKDGSTHT